MTMEQTVNLNGLFTDPPSPTGEMSLALKQARHDLPTLRERLDTPDDSILMSLKQNLEQRSDSGNVIEWAHQLTSRDILYLFPLLVRLSGQKQANAELINRLHLLIRERACPSMYQSGWIVFQQSYRQPEIGKALALLCSILEIRQIRQTEPGLHLISDIIRPDRQMMIRDLTKAMVRQSMTLADLAGGYQLDCELPLYQELAAHALLHGRQTHFATATEQFPSIFRHADTQLQIRLLKRLLKFWSMPAPLRNRCCQVVYRQIGDDFDQHPVWQKINKKNQRKFSHWLTSAKIGSHCRQHPERARLYLRYEAQIEKVVSRDEQTLLIYLPSGVIADSQRETDQAIFYDRTQAARWLSRTKSDRQSHPLNPPIPKRRVDEAIRRGSCHGVIALPFDPEGIRYTRIFLDLCLRTQTQRSRKKTPSQPVRRSD